MYRGNEPNDKERSHLILSNNTYFQRILNFGIEE